MRAGAAASQGISGLGRGERASGELRRRGAGTLRGLSRLRRCLACADCRNIRSLDVQ